MQVQNCLIYHRYSLGKNLLGKSVRQLQIVSKSLIVEQHVSRSQELQCLGEICSRTLSTAGPLEDILIMINSFGLYRKRSILKMLLPHLVYSPHWDCWWYVCQASFLMVNYF